MYTTVSSSSPVQNLLQVGRRQNFVWLCPTRTSHLQLWGVLASSLLSGTPLFTSNDLPTCLKFKVQILQGVKLTLSELSHIMLLLVPGYLNCVGHLIGYVMACAPTHPPSAIPVLSASSLDAQSFLQSAKQLCTYAHNIIYGPASLP